MTKCLASCIGKAGKFLCCIYGSSELVFLTQFLVENETDLTEYACGTPLKLKGLEMKIVDENGQTLPVNTRGEIYVKTPGMFKGYLNDLEKTKAVMTPDGWYKSDDIGRINENGLFFVEGRKSNMIISGGLKVAPEILEQVIKTFPGVETAVIVPVPDDIYYQVVCACVVRKPGSDLTEEMLRKVCEDVHADKPGLFTVLPKFYMFIDKLPETNTGKIDRRAIIKIACDKFK
jgi:acyl-coenzyme A synthetase/AMP-(fatty) acid ligase